MRRLLIVLLDALEFGGFHAGGEFLTELLEPPYGIGLLNDDLIQLIVLVLQLRQV